MRQKYALLLKIVKIAKRWELRSQIFHWPRRFGVLLPNPQPLTVKYWLRLRRIFDTLLQFFALSLSLHFPPPKRCWQDGPETVTGSNEYAPSYKKYLSFHCIYEFLSKFSDYTFSYKNNFIRTRGSFLLKI